ncbi:MAG: hypothetical protein ACRDMV_18105 [Streptosporangiales bacterium]
MARVIKTFAAGNSVYQAGAEYSDDDGVVKAHPEFFDAGTPKRPATRRRKPVEGEESGADHE